MATERRPADQDVREHAVDPGVSCIVQAPAGSGKTSLLTLRFLRLLTTVEDPEEVLAITFTRKAAAEMRHRIVEALAEADAPAKPGASSHELSLKAAARAAVSRSAQRGWDLDRQPSRLRVQTIDSLNHWLARRLPLTAGLGVGLNVVDDASPLFAEAARRVLERLEDDEDQSFTRSLARLLRHFDNNARLVSDRLADLLARREQWLPRILDLGTGEAARASMEGLMAALVESELACTRALPRDLVSQAVELGRAALEDPKHIAGTEPLGSAPTALEPSARHHEQWAALGRLLLVSDGGALRKTVNAANGFPKEGPLRKPMIAVLNTISGDDDMVDAVLGLGRLPPAGYGDEQWALIEALLVLLPRASAELQQIFAERGQVDHAAVAGAARQAVGTPEAPTDFALSLDYRIRHILVDEYQDTSAPQVRLLEQLTAGWTAGDGRTLFCVGDPMQSIYRFRDADVSLFLEAQQSGIGSVRLERLTLSANFRSRPALVRWVNRTFARVLGQDEDFERGAVAFSDSEPTRDEEPGAGVRVHPVLGGDRAQEAMVVETIVQATRREDGAARVAVLVRSREHLAWIVPRLRAAGLPYTAVELEGLSERPAVRDLMALTRALLHPADRTAWLAVLRAPWCGLELGDLLALADPGGATQLPERLRDSTALAALDGDTRSRVERLSTALAEASADRGRRPLGSWVESAWLALHGPATVADESDLENARAYFGLLDELEREAGPCPEPSALERMLESLMARPAAGAEDRLQLMTIHKAKGLEFDVVILPGLDRGIRRDTGRLLYWTTVVARSPAAPRGVARGVVLAVPRASSADSDPHESWMQGLERERAELEARRLLYVATTRARQRLHLVGAVRVKVDEQQAASLTDPLGGSLLQLLWEDVRHDFESAMAASIDRGTLPASDPDDRPRAPVPELRRLKAGFARPPLPEAVPRLLRRVQPASEEPVRPEFDWVSESARHVGSVVHDELARIAGDALPVDVDGWASVRRAAWARQLAELGVVPAERAGAERRVERALRGVLADGFGRWLLDREHAGATSELALTAVLDGEPVSVKIDRTFLDRDGVRWIVDWKTSEHEGGGLDTFLDQEVGRYAQQLARYARVLSLQDGDATPQRLALYFPLLGQWREWQPPAGRRGA